jgi:hypothetical protein
MDVLVDAGFVCDKDVMLMGKMKAMHCSVPQRTTAVTGSSSCELLLLAWTCSDQTNAFLADAICSSWLL